MVIRLRTITRPFIGCAPPPPQERWVITKMWERAAPDALETTVSVRPRLFVSQVDAACDAARAGIGVARVFFHHIAASIDAGTLVTVLDDFEPTPLPVNLLYTAGRFLPIKVRAFLDIAAPRLKAQLARD